ncbi:glycosyltransferase family 4 protein [Phocea massiliensis]|uniref:Glycosyltransferase family 4 protein n=1 Tax=Merdimmobilis hominis TaxID=2897707 RepID=A0A938X5L4_9FIRM|nr:glycosyltransferase family 4 protein [Merdimmobilis hominis]MBM6920225.1 glycosyltransferase family 4 protein [Merdimmobilis hominis]
MKKILHINSYYQHSRFYKNLYDRQFQKAQNIAVYVPVSSNDNNSFDYGSYALLDNCFNSYDRIFFHLKHGKIFSSIEKRYDWSNISLIHAHSLFSNGYIAYKLYKKYNIPYIVAVRNTDVNVFFKKMLHLRKMGVNILKNAKRIIFISQNYLELTRSKYIPKQFEKEFLEKSVVLPNGVDQYYIDHALKTPKIPHEDAIDFLYVGEINQNKNVLFSAKCIDKLNHEGKCTFTMVGKITDKKIYQTVSAYDFVKHISPQKKETLISYYRNADIFIMPSITETFGLVYVEAMTQGVPVIYTKGQGFDNQFPNGQVGYAVSSDSAEEVIEAVHSILDNYKELSNNCISLSKKFNWDFITEQYDAIYNLLLE